MAAPGLAATQCIADFAESTDVSAGPPELVAAAEAAVIDTIGVCIAGGATDAFGILHTVTESELAPGSATVFPLGCRTTPGQAAFLNGTASHALDFDDVTDPLRGHASAVLVPALWAVAESSGASGRGLLEAYVIGFEVTCAIAGALPIDDHYRRGWHSTSTVGVVAGAAAVSRLLGLSRDATRQALGIAASMASGSRRNFGTMTKPLHAGMASRDAVLAARLAEAGFTADIAQLESPLGFFSMYGKNSDLRRLEESLSSPWALLSDGINVKKYPCCYSAHRAADAALNLAAALEPGEAADSEAFLTLQPGGLGPLIHHRPSNGLEGKFSAEYIVSAALLDKQISLHSFTDEAVRRPQVQRLMQRVEVREAGKPPVGEDKWHIGYAVLDVRHGERLSSERVDVPRGDARNPLTSSELEEKFRDCVHFSRPDVDSARLLEGLRQLPRMAKVAGFCDLLGEAP